MNININKKGERLRYWVDHKTVWVSNQDKGTCYEIEQGECTCEGYKYRNECKHIDGFQDIRQLVETGERE